MATRSLDIYLIGLGGIGAGFLDKLSQHLHGDSHTHQRLSRIYLVDGDVVEGKNLARTPFHVRHIGKPKVTCCAQMFLDRLPITPINTYINRNNLPKLFEESNVKEKDLLVIVCTDHMYERASVLNLLMSTAIHNENIFWVTAGNALKEGSALSWLRKDGVNNPLDFPNPFDYSPRYQEMLTLEGRDSHTGNLGCGMDVTDAVAAGQSLLINTLSQLALLHIVQSYLLKEIQVPFVKFQEDEGVISLSNPENWNPKNISSSEGSKFNLLSEDEEAEALTDYEEGEALTDYEEDDEFIAYDDESLEQEVLDELDNSDFNYETDASLR